MVLPVVLFALAIGADREAVEAWRSGRFEEALARYRSALGARTAGDPAIPALVSDIGELQRTLGRFREAERSQRKALEIREKTLGPDHPDVASSLNNLAEVLRAQRRFKAAEAMYRRALAILARNPRPDLPTQAAVLGNLGQALHALHRDTEAEESLRRSLELWNRSGEANPDAAIAANNLAVLLRDRGKLEEADALYQRVLAECERSLGPEHLNTALVLLNLADLERLRKHYGDAETLFRRALPVLEAVLQPDHPDRAGALSMYALLLKETGRSREAKNLLAQAREIEGRHARSDGSAMLLDARDFVR